VAKVIKLADLQTRGAKSKAIQEVVLKVNSQFSKATVKEGEGIEVSFKEVGLETPDWMTLDWVREYLKKKYKTVSISKVRGVIVVA